MKTTWPGLDYVVQPVSTDAQVYAPSSTRLVLSDPPGVVTTLTLPLGTLLVRLWSTTGDEVWYAVDTTPGPIPPAQLDPVLPATVFLPGDVLVPGERQYLAVPNDARPHTLQLVSGGANTVVLVTAYLDPGS